MTWWGSDPLGLYKNLKFEHPNKWNIYNQESVLGNETHKDTDRSFNHDQTPRPSYSQQENKKMKRKTGQRVDFVVPADHSVKLRESEK